MLSVRCFCALLRGRTGSLRVDFGGNKSYPNVSFILGEVFLQNARCVVFTCLLGRIFCCRADTPVYFPLVVRNSAIEETGLVPPGIHNDPVCLCSVWLVFPPRSNTPLSLQLVEDAGSGSKADKLVSFRNVAFKF